MMHEIEALSQIRLERIITERRKKQKRGRGRKEKRESKELVENVDRKIT